MFEDGICKCVYLFNNDGFMIMSYYIDTLRILSGRFVFTIKFEDTLETDRALYHFEKCSRGLMRSKIRFIGGELVFEPEVIQASRNMFSGTRLVVEIKMPR